MARLDIKGDKLVKSVNLEGVRVVGDPREYATKYDALGIDEIVYIDTVASLYRRNGLADLLEQTTQSVFCPVTVAGGIRSVEDVRRLLNAGADKIAVNTAAVERPELISEIAEKFGSQAVVLQIDAKRTGQGWEARTDGGRERGPGDCVAWAQRAAALGAGEIFLTSIDREGTRRGPDRALVSAVAQAVNIPVIYSGGIGSAGHIAQVAHDGASGCAMAHVLHFGTVTPMDMRKALSDAGVGVRMAA